VKPLWFGKGGPVSLARFYFSGDRLPGASSQHLLLQEEGEAAVFELSLWTTDNKQLALFYAVPSLALEALREDASTPAPK
jgi:hypothetical protein